MTYTRVHTRVTFADPNLRCDECRGAVPAWHDPDQCGCGGTAYNLPCGHTGATSACPSWSPVDGCRCPGRPHLDRAAALAPDADTTGGGDQP